MLDRVAYRSQRMLDPARSALTHLITSETGLISPDSLDVCRPWWRPRRFRSQLQERWSLGLCPDAAPLALRAKLHMSRSRTLLSLLDSLHQYHPSPRCSWRARRRVQCWPAVVDVVSKILSFEKQTPGFCLKEDPALGNGMVTGAVRRLVKAQVGRLIEDESVLSEQVGEQDDGLTLPGKLAPRPRRVNVLHSAQC